ncbi:MAG: hypothetical protein P1T08_09130 [Acidimicrobiia bacterium]|nr:hypothetical protein [Acidimicrobiia bacterium]
MQRLPAGLIVRSAFVHEGTPRRLVHRLKFEGLFPAAEWLAARMAPLIEGFSGTLVPIPRTGTRRLRYGVDAALILARVLGRVTGNPIGRAVRAPLWTPSHTGRGSARRRPPMFFSKATNQPILLIDDVITTGSTLQSAAGVLNGMVVGAVTATRAVKVTSLLSEEYPWLVSQPELPGSEVERGSSSPR